MGFGCAIMLYGYDRIEVLITCYNSYIYIPIFLTRYGNDIRAVRGHILGKLFLDLFGS